MLWGSSHSLSGRRPGVGVRVLQNRNVLDPESGCEPYYPCQVTETANEHPTDKLRARILSAWKRDPLFIDPIIAPGLTKSQRAAVEQAADDTARSGLPYFIAIVPQMPIPDSQEEPWPRFTADLAYSVHKDQGTEQTIVLFSEPESGAESQAYLVDDNGPVTPKLAGQLVKSKSDDFLPLELAVAYHLGVLVAAAQGTEPPPLPDFDTRDAGDSNEDYIQALGLGNGNPDALVFGATAAAALGLSVWVLRRRAKYSWRKSLTTKPTLIKSAQLPERVEAARAPLPDPVEPSEEMWRLYDRGRRIQAALEALVDAHPGWADDADFSHRYGVFTLVTTHKWVRARLRGSASAREDEPRFCFLLPYHRKGIERFALPQEGTTLEVDLCRACRDEINAGHDPECLMVPKRPGSLRSRPVPYFRRSDAYAVSGFGSFQPLEDAVLESQGVSAGAQGRRG